MNVVNIVILIRVLFVLAMICLLVLAGAWLARAERRPAANPDGDALRNRAAMPAIAHGNLGYRAAGERQKSNHAGAVAHGVQRRAA